VSSTDKIRTALIATLSYEEREAIIERLGSWFETETDLPDSDFDVMLEEARAGTVLRRQVEEAKWAELKESDGQESDLATAMVEGPSVDPEWQKHHEAAMRFGIEWGGDEDPRPRCYSHVLMRGDSRRCDGVDDHRGWAHWNGDLGVMWQ
jgi:hypothetical protein